jgi:REP element-mobilizing transposase RayT
VSVPPTLTISRWIGELKGASAYYVNQTLLNRTGALEWQTGYGVVSFGARDVSRVADYIGNQEDHHRERAAKEREGRYRGPLAANRP